MWIAQKSPPQRQVTAERKTILKPFQGHIEKIKEIYMFRL
jgi:hypothetical protein